jgi:alpha-tubulin suppressor-like RCC1 family protein
VDRNGAVDCKGEHRRPEIGSAIRALRDVRILALGDDHGCALRRDGTILCVGDDTHGQLGTDRLLVSLTPVLVK